MTPDELARLRALCEAATPGPWEVAGNLQTKVFDEVVAPHRTGNPEWCEGVADCDTGEEDAEFIATARTAVPALIAEVERLTAELDRLMEGSDPSTAVPGQQASHAQALHAMLTKSPVDRLNMFALMRDYALAGSECAGRDHVGELESVRAERDDLAAQMARVEALAESGIASEAKAVAELERQVILVREYAKMRETYGKRGRTVHSSRIASDLFGIVGDDRAALAGDGER